MTDYADRHMDVTERDHARLCAAIADGAIAVVRDIGCVHF
jgi:hypothetical protein